MAKLVQNWTLFHFRAAERARLKDLGPYSLHTRTRTYVKPDKMLVTDQNDPFRTLPNILVDSSSRLASPNNWHGGLIALTLKSLGLWNNFARLVQLTSAPMQTSQISLTS